MDHILFEEMPAKAGKLGVITLQRPQALNALSLEMLNALLSQLKTWAGDDAIHAVIIKSAAERAFCAGGDIRALYNHRGAIAEQLPFFEAEYQLNYLIGTYPKPYIALMHGITMGGGAGVAVHGSHRVACENFLFAMPETAIGLFPDIGAGYFLNRAPGYLGVYLALSGARLKAEDAIYANVADYFISSNHYSEVIQALADVDLPQGAAHDKVTEVLRGFSVEPDESSLKPWQNLIDGVFCADSMYRLLQYLKDDTSEWSQAVSDHLMQKSPMSLAVTLQMMALCRDKSLAKCLEQDFILVQSFLAGHDLYEGIRAVVIDKDMKPIWAPSKLDDISDDQVNAYFDTVNKKTLGLL